MLFLIR